MSQAEEVTAFSADDENLKTELKQNGYAIRVFKTEFTITSFRCQLSTQAPKSKKSVLGKTVTDALANAARAVGV